MEEVHGLESFVRVNMNKLATLLMGPKVGAKNFF